MMGNWDDLRLFLAVAREQSLSGAGKLLRLDPATLGRRMARLEKTMQAVLFVKSPSGYALTEAGVEHDVQIYDGAPHSFFDRRFEEHADASANAWERVLAFIQSHSKQLTGAGV